MLNTRAKGRPRVDLRPRRSSFSRGSAERAESNDDTDAPRCEEGKPLCSQSLQGATPRASRSPTLGSAILSPHLLSSLGHLSRWEKEPAQLGGCRGINPRTKSSSRGEDLCQLARAPAARPKLQGLTEQPLWAPPASCPLEGGGSCPPWRRKGGPPGQEGGHEEGRPPPSGQLSHCPLSLNVWRTPPPHTVPGRLFRRRTPLCTPRPAGCSVLRICLCVEARPSTPVAPHPVLLQASPALPSTPDPVTPPHKDTVNAGGSQELGWKRPSPSDSLPGSAWLWGAWCYGLSLSRGTASEWGCHGLSE